MIAPANGAASGNPLDLLPVGRRQLLLLVLAVLLAALDGYDALSMAFVAPVIALEWNIGKDVIGLLLASSLVGMALGAIVLSPMADKFGRRAIVLLAITILIAGAALSAVSVSVPLLAGSRLLTGSGIGVMVAMTTLISAEFTNLRKRSLAVAAVATMGFPLGGIIGGLASSKLLEHASWHWVFLVGSMAGGVMFALVFLLLPDSPTFLIAQRSPDALEKVNRVMACLGHRSITELPAAADQKDSRYGLLFEVGLRGIVLRLMAIAILIATSSYYIINWLPQLVVDAGFTPAQGSMVSALSGLFGFLGGVGFASLASRFARTKLAAIAMMGGALGLTAVGLAPPTISLLVASAGFLSFCLSGTTGLLYAIMADSFPPAMRASGMGLVMGGARIASAAGPALAGVMFAHRMTRADVSMIFAVGPLVAAALMITFQPSPKSKQSGSAQFKRSK